MTFLYLKTTKMYIKQNKSSKNDTFLLQCNILDAIINTNDNTLTPYMADTFRGESFLYKKG